MAYDYYDNSLEDGNDIKLRQYELQKAMEWWKTLSIDKRQAIRWVLGNEIGEMTDDKYLDAYKKAKRQNF